MGRLCAFLLGKGRRLRVGVVDEFLIIQRENAVIFCIVLRLPLSRRFACGTGDKLPCGGGFFSLDRLAHQHFVLERIGDLLNGYVYLWIDPLQFATAAVQDEVREHHDSQVDRLRTRN